MNYMLLIYRTESPTDPMMTHEQALHACDGLAERLHAAGKHLSGGILQPTCTATSLRLRDGKRLITDGPFAETREQLAGYVMVKANDLDEAIDIAAEHPAAKFGTVEIRPLLLLNDFSEPSEVTASSTR